MLLPQRVTGCSFRRSGDAPATLPPPRLTPVRLVCDARRMIPTINPDRLWQTIMDMARIGPTPEGGSCRSFKRENGTLTVGLTFLEAAHG